MNVRHSLIWMLLLFAFLSPLTGCDSGGGGGGGGDGSAVFDTADEEGDGGGGDSINLTGTWRRPGLPSVYELRQSGSSLQGRYYEPNDPNVTGDIAGTVDGDDIEMDVVVDYADDSQADFTAHKSGTILGEDHIELVVTDSPKYQGQVQQWYR